jgi:predicted RNase H-like HicB family nuclease
MGKETHRVLAIVEGQKGRYGAFVPDVPMFFAVGSRVKEILHNIKRDLPVAVDFLKEEGEPVVLKEYDQQEVEEIIKNVCKQKKEEGDRNGDAVTAKYVYVSW